MYGETGRLSAARGQISLQILRHALPIIAMATILWIRLAANASVEWLICEMRAADAVESEQCHGKLSKMRQLVCASHYYARRVSLSDYCGSANWYLKVI